ncbi:uncharacterized protein LOC134690310 [Mytilus trossulus]|uniref:uncharacterized protein LOC134690310 n=1 Tax=Mytilus trossulus TaxID=6551 RepID=UPI0030063420
MMSYILRKIPVTILLICAVLQLTSAEQSPLCFEVQEGLTNGCSVPLFGKFPYKKIFEPACQLHDLCYNCGIAQSKDRKYCDKIFLKKMKQICSTRKGWRKRSCKRFSRLYYVGVCAGGKSSFRQTPKAECSVLDWIASCFP